MCVIPAAAYPPAISAQHAIVTDADTGAVLYEKDADSPSLIASTTKIMTGCLICERCDLQAQITVPTEAVGIEGSSMYLKPGEKLTVKDLLYGMLLQSGNDAAVALAIHCSGSVEQFVTEMNGKAAALGLKNTHFANPNGLDDAGNYGSARDLAALTAYALKNEAFAEAVSTKTYSAGTRCLANHNKLLWQYDGAIGVKTGYTKAAGRILVSAAVRNGRTLICVTISAPNDWNDHRNLLDCGFAQYNPTQIATAGAVLCRVPLASTTAGEVPLIAQKTVSVPLLAGETVSCTFPEKTPVFPPFLKGDIAGTVLLTLGGKTFAAVPVVWGRTVLD